MRRGYRVVDVQIETCGIQLPAGVDIGGQFVILYIISHAAVLCQSVFRSVHDGGGHVAYNFFCGAVHDIGLHDEAAVGSAVIARNRYRVIYNQFVSYYLSCYGTGLRIRVLRYHFHFVKGDATVNIGIYFLFIVHFAQLIFHLHVEDQRTVFGNAYFIVSVGSRYGIGIEE